MKDLLAKNWRPVLIAVLSTVGLINTVPQVKRVVVPETKPAVEQVLPCTTVMTEEQLVKVLQKLRQLPPPKFEFKLKQELR